MDTILKTSLGIFVVVLVLFSGVTMYTGYTEAAYQNTLAGTYSYTCWITTDGPLYNVTLFIPVPADVTGNSPMVSEFSSRTMKGIPPAWNTTLFDTGKSTLIRIMTPALLPPEGTTASGPYTVMLSSETTSRTPIDTRNPVEKSAIFRPVQALNETTCPAGRAGDSVRCFTYTTAVYADYRAAGDTTVSIAAAITGRNTWTVFGPHSNEYHSDVSITMKGEQQGWRVLEGELTSGTGTFEVPAGS
jgi:hypothetical protein